MALTKINPSEVVPSGSITRAMLNTATSGSAVATKIIAGTGISLSSTGADAGTGDVTVTATGGGSFTGGTLTSALVLATGSTSLTPIQIPAGTLNTTPIAGGLEYDGKAFYGDWGSGNRGVLQSASFGLLSSPYTLTSQTAAQKAFNFSTNGAITLPIGYYEFEVLLLLTGMSATSGSMSFLFGGTAVFGIEAWLEAAKNANHTAVGAASESSIYTQNAGFAPAYTIVTPANTNTEGSLRLRGIMSVTTAGTVIPQVAMSVAAAAIVQTFSYAKFTPLGNSNLVGPWS